MRTLLSILVLLAVALVAPAAAQLNDAAAFFRTNGEDLFHVDANDVATELDLDAAVVAAVFDPVGGELLAIAQKFNFTYFETITVELDGSSTDSYHQPDPNTQLGLWTGPSINPELKMVTLGDGDRFILGYQRGTSSIDNYVFGFNWDDNPASSYQEKKFTGKRIEAVVPHLVGSARYVYIFFTDGSGKYATIPFTGLTSFADVGGFNAPTGARINDGASDGTSIVLGGTMASNISGDFALLYCDPNGQVSPEDWVVTDKTADVLEGGGSAWFTWSWTKGITSIQNHFAGGGWGYRTLTGAPAHQGVWTKAQEGGHNRLEIGGDDDGTCFWTPFGLLGIGSQDRVWISTDQGAQVQAWTLDSEVTVIDISGEEECQIWPTR